MRRGSISTTDSEEWRILDKKVEEERRAEESADLVTPPEAYSAVTTGIFLGVAISQVEYALAVHDGYYVLEYVSSEFSNSAEKHNHEEQLIQAIIHYMARSGEKIVGAGLSRYTFDYQKSEELGMDIQQLMSRMWLSLDIVPLRIYSTGRSIREVANSVARKAVRRFGNHNIPRMEIGFRHEVEVDFEGTLQLADLHAYRSITDPSVWSGLVCFAQRVRQNQAHISFFSATPQGGGVALMRHGMIRLLRQLGVKVNWYVVKPMPEVFHITKRKIHNVLQGVAPPEICLTDTDIELFERWTKDNVESYNDGPGSPIFESNVFVIDDPQVCGLVPHIRELNPDARIIFRSHIELRTDLIQQKGSPQERAWDFIWSNIKDCDAFVSHPISGFVPSGVPRNRSVMLPACTDPLDGLNKPLSKRDCRYYLRMFNNILHDLGQSPLDTERPYIIQIARFDPSKGIPDVLESYVKMRRKIDKESNIDSSRIPQLVLCGHGSVDDPDGMPVYGKVMKMLQNEPCKTYAHDVHVAKLPPSDQILNSLLRESYIALQLSHREGFEVKVTESLSKGVPVIAYRTGGIPLQIQDGKTGFLVEVGDTDAVAARLCDLVTDNTLRRNMSEEGKTHYQKHQEYFTPFHTTNWLFLFLKLLEDGEIEGNLRRVADMWDNE